MAKNRLTLKQERFCQAYVKSNGNGTEAVRQAYPEVKDYGTQRSMASENLTKPHINARIQEILGGSGLTLELIVRALKELIDNGREGTKVRALRIVLTMLGLIGRRRMIVTNQVNVEQDISKSDQALLDKYITINKSITE